MIVTIIAALVALVIGGAAGYFIFRYVIKGKYNEMIEAANKEAEVVKEKCSSVILASSRMRIS